MSTFAVFRITRTRRRIASGLSAQEAWDLVAVHVPPDWGKHVTVRKVRYEVVEEKT